MSDDRVASVRKHCDGCQMDQWHQFRNLGKALRPYADRAPAGLGFSPALGASVTAQTECPSARTVYRATVRLSKSQLLNPSVRSLKFTVDFTPVDADSAHDIRPERPSLPGELIEADVFLSLNALGPKCASRARVARREMRQTGEGTRGIAVSCEVEDVTPAAAVLILAHERTQTVVEMQARSEACAGSAQFTAKVADSESVMMTVQFETATLNSPAAARTEA